MKKKFAFCLMLLVAFTYQVAMAYFDPPDWTQSYVFGSTQSPTTAYYYGEGRTGDGRSYLTATCAMYENYVLRATNYQLQLQPNINGVLSATVSYYASRPVGTTVFVEATTWHEAADLPTGADKGVSNGYASSYYTFGGKSVSSVEDATYVTGLQNLQEMHAAVRKALAINSEDTLYFNYQNIHNLLNGKVSLFNNDRELTQSLARSVVHAIAEHTKIGDLGAGIWINTADNSCVIGIGKADGTVNGVHLAISNHEDSTTWIITEARLSTE